MSRSEKEQMIIGSISLLSNKLSQIGDQILPEITYKQFFLLLMISKMELEEKNINDITELTGTSRQNVKKMLTHLEKKGYVMIGKSTYDSRALNIEVTPKTLQYFVDNGEIADLNTNQLFKKFTVDEIDTFIQNLDKLMKSLLSHEEIGDLDE